VTWIPVTAWAAAIVVAFLALGFCAYEVLWRVRRLRRELVHLRTLGDDLAQLRTGAAGLRGRLARAGAR
jgi:hypothetical protein